MTDHFEDELRRSLRPIQPPAGFAARVMQALPARGASATVTRIAAARPARSPGTWQRLRAPAALAASLLVAVLLGQQWAIHQQQAQEAAGLAASQELMQALRVTSKKLDLAYQAVKSPPEAPAEENRS
jgi:hypothetical protein